MNITDMTRKEFEALPLKGWREDIGEFNSAVILPTRLKHDSGWGIMDFVAVKGGEPICRLSGCTDDLSLKAGHSDWRIDMLFKSKLLHIRPNNLKMVTSCAISSMDFTQTK